MKKKFYILIGIYIALALADGALTFINTPDLKLEGNPLVSVFGFGWESLIIANILGFVLVFFSSYYTFIKYEPMKTSVNNRREYLSQIFFNRPDKFAWTFYKWPPNRQPIYAYAGYVLMYGMITARIVVIFQWIIHDMRVYIYDYIRGKMPFGRMDIVIMLIVIIILSIHITNKQFKANNNLVKDTYKC